MTDNEDFVKTINGGKTTIDALRYLIIAVFDIYTVPVIVSLFALRRCDFIFDILASTPAFIYYGPTYLIILNTYALCRIDDISWGTKGLDTDTGLKGSK